MKLRSRQFCLSSFSLFPSTFRHPPRYSFHPHSAIPKWVLFLLSASEQTAVYEIIGWRCSCAHLGRVCGSRGVYFPHGSTTPSSGPELPLCQGFTITHTHHTRSDSSGGEISPSQRPLADYTQQYIHASWRDSNERPQTHALDRAATGIGRSRGVDPIILIVGAGLSWVASFTTRSLYPLGKGPLYLLLGGCLGPRVSLDTLDKNKWNRTTIPRSSIPLGRSRRYKNIHCLWVAVFW